MLGKHIVRALVLCFCLTPVCIGAENELDLSTLDNATLRIMVKSMMAQNKMLHDKVDRLEAELRQAKEQATGKTETGAAVATSWTVTITANQPPDITAIDAEITTLREELNGRRSSRNSGGGFVGLNSRISSLSSDISEKATNRVYNSKGKQVLEYTPQQLAPLKVQLSQMQAKQRRLNVGITKLEKQRDQVRTTREIHAVLEDGSPVLIVARGPQHAIGAAMRVGDIYEISGAGRTIRGALRVILRSAVPLAAEAPVRVEQDHRRGRR